MYRFACTREDVAAARDEARRQPTAHEHLMTDLPNSAADRAANASTSDGETPAGDPELAALVRRDALPDDADPSLAALLNIGRRPLSSAVPAATAAGAPGGPVAGAPAADETA